MGATLLQLRDQVKRLLNNDDFFSDLVLDDHINTSYYHHHAVVTDALEHILALQDFIDTTTNVRKYDLSLIKTTGRIVDQLIRLEYFGSDISSISYSTMAYQTRDNEDEVSTFGVPQTYELIGNEIIVDPPPNKDLVDGLRLTFNPHAETLVDPTDTIEDVFIGPGERCIVHFAVMIAKQQEELWDPQTSAAGGFSRNYEALLFRFKNNLEMRAFEEDEIESFDVGDV